MPVNFFDEDVREEFMLFHQLMAQENLQQADVVIARFQALIGEAREAVARPNHVQPAAEAAAPAAQPGFAGHFCNVCMEIRQVSFM